MDVSKSLNSMKCFDLIIVCCSSMCLKYAELEAKLGEIDRARAVYVHGSQMSDPRVSFLLYKFPQG